MLLQFDLIPARVKGRVLESRGQKARAAHAFAPRIEAQTKN